MIIMNKLIAVSAFAGLTLISCSKEQQQDKSTAEIIADSVTHAVYPEDTVKTVPVGDTTETSVDWNGTYSGTLPCASCPGIETTLVLNGDKTYTMKEVYLEEKDGVFNSNGNFTFDSSGSFITLHNPNESSENRVFFVGEGHMWMAENVGDRSMKDDYKLVKK